MAHAVSYYSTNPTLVLCWLYTARVCLPCSHPTMSCEPAASLWQLVQWHSTSVLFGKSRYLCSCNGEPQQVSPVHNANGTTHGGESMVWIKGMPCWWHGCECSCVAWRQACNAAFNVCRNWPAVQALSWPVLAYLIPSWVTTTSKSGPRSGTT